MSHFTKVKTKIFDLDILEAVLKKLNYEVSSNVHSLKGYRGKTINVDLLVKLKSSYDIGFVKSKDKSFELVADWYGVKNFNKQEFMSKVMQNYSLEVVKREVKKKGYKIVEQKNVENNSIKIVVRKW